MRKYFNEVGFILAFDEGVEETDELVEEDKGGDSKTGLE